VSAICLRLCSLTSELILIAYLPIITVVILKTNFHIVSQVGFIFDSKRTSQNFNLELERKILKQNSLNKLNGAKGMQTKGTPDLFEIEMQKGRAKNPFKNGSTLNQNKPDWFETKGNKPSKRPIVTRNHTPNYSIANASVM